MRRKETSTSDSTSSWVFRGVSQTQDRGIWSLGSYLARHLSNNLHVHPLARRNLPPDAEVRPNNPLFPCRNLASFVLHVSSVSVPARGGHCFSVDHVGTVKHAANHRGKAQRPETNNRKGGAAATQPLGRFLGREPEPGRYRYDAGNRNEPLRGLIGGWIEIPRSCVWFLMPDALRRRAIGRALAYAWFGTWPCRATGGATESVEAVLLNGKMMPYFLALPVKTKEEEAGVLRRRWQQSSGARLAASCASASPAKEADDDTTK